MNPSANSSSPSGPIFSGDPAPVPPAETPPAGAPTPTPDPVFTPKNDDIILQPSQPAKNPALQKYKKPLIIVGIVLAVVICILLIISAISKKSPVDEEAETEFYATVASVHGMYESVLDTYDRLIGLSPAGTSLEKHPENILFLSPDIYVGLYGDAEGVIVALEKLSQLSVEGSNKKYRTDISEITDTVKSEFTTIADNSKLISQFSDAFIAPIQNTEGWKSTGCNNGSEAKKLINNSDTKISTVAKQYYQLSCNKDIQITFDGEVVQIPQSVDTQTLGDLKNIADALSKTLTPVVVKDKTGVLSKFQKIIEENQDKYQNLDEESENETKE